MNLKEQLQSAIDYCNDKLSAKGVTEQATSVVDIGNKIESIQSDQLTKIMTTFDNIFYKASFPSETNIVLEYGENFNGDITNCFAYTPNSNIKTIKFIGPKNDNILANNFMLNCSVETVDFTECEWAIRNNTAVQSYFKNCSKLISILGTIDYSNAYSFISIFDSCRALKDIRFIKENLYKSISFVNSPLLTNESIQSIIDGLADLTGQTAQTLTLHSTVSEKLTKEQESTILSKGWTLK